MITFISIMRDAKNYIDRYFAQINAVEADKRVVVLEGDSTDGTKETLAVKNDPGKIDIVTWDTGAPRFPSVDFEPRWAQLEQCWNRAMLELQPCDWVICVESDLIWTPDIPLKQIEIVEADIADVSCPLLFINHPQAGTIFYDINGFRSSGKRWDHFPPHCPVSYEYPFAPLDTGGGMLVGRYKTMIQGTWKDKCRLHFPEDTRFVADMSSIIYHPS